MSAAWEKTIKTAMVLPAFLLVLSGGAGEAIRPIGREADIDRIIYEMERVRQDIADLVTVVEHTATAPGGRAAVTKITLTFKRPDKLKTEVAGGREVLINGDRMWIYSPEIGVVEAYHLKDEEQRRAAIYEMSWGLTSPIRVLLRGTKRSSTRLDDGDYLVTVIPDGAETEISRIEARVDPRTWLIKRMTISPRSGSPVELKISEWKINTGLPDSRFEFRLPEGADLFEPLETGGETLQ
jgi:outer membrane lipoprotein carrier protein